MSCSASWQSVLVAPASGQHVAQLYTDPEFLARLVGDFAGEGLRSGEAVILIAVPSRRRRIARRLEEQGVELDEAQCRGQLTILDAATCLERCLVDGMPDAARFAAVIGGVVEAVRRAGYQRIRAFGEMVDLLRRTDLVATMRLEELWNDLLAAHGISLLCGYSVDAFDPRVYHGLVQRVCGVHSDLIPVEHCARLEQAVERAYGEIFGPAGDGDALRRAFVGSYDRPTSMPDGAAAILAAEKFVPAAIVTLLDRARHHYRVSAAPHAGD